MLAELLSPFKWLPPQSTCIDINYSHYYLVFFFFFFTLFSEYHSCWSCKWNLLKGGGFAEIKWTAPSGNSLSVVLQPQKHVPWVSKMLWAYGEERSPEVPGLVMAREYCQRRWWHPTPVLLPGKSHGRRSLVGCLLWGCTEPDTTEAT